MHGLELGGLDVVLGSTSKWRRAVFEEHFPGVLSDTAAPNIDEEAVTAGYKDRASADPSELTLAIAHAKANALSSERDSGLLVTSDQVLSYKGTIREVRGCAPRSELRAHSC